MWRCGEAWVFGAKHLLFQNPLHTLTLPHHAITPAAPATAPTNPIFLYPFPRAAPVACPLALANVIVLLTPSVVVVVDIDIDIVTSALVFVTASLELEPPALTRVFVPLISVTAGLESTGGVVSIARPVGAVDDSDDAGGVRKLAYVAALLGVC
ncbi:predicted protein [Pyrenophora tritici-repentis Pt-1C-BFP]|uniref:Uncharacterized protein n=1 Tax=Pyrenophora tritici-repentis (strain Pt-1C-BFP) TaxID=426418 RepID=B2WDN1_PYRTR|nr:uncharacterized protein PTRG_08090 [Pyrenophora tritici-repentis Pt-1C-BFP]EDU51009.1 predicted protein [Pyrenophora tritici-repentis Pt-1C-BFP]